MRQVLIMILRRDESDLLPEERQAILDKFSGANVKFVRMDPANHVEHNDNCVRLQPDAVILPMDKPIPSTAMKNGFAHIAFHPERASMMELEPLVPTFREFVPAEE